MATGTLAEYMEMDMLCFREGWEEAHYTSALEFLLAASISCNRRTVRHPTPCHRSPAMHPSLHSHSRRVAGHFERLRRELDDAFSADTFPAINVSHNATRIEVQAFAPGINPDQVEVTIDRGVLTLVGERASTPLDPSHAPDGKVVARSLERGSGRFKRAISLPDDADPERVTAAYRDGVLHIGIARREAVQAKRITIQ
jgi:HSP20 family protein